MVENATTWRKNLLVNNFYIIGENGMAYSRVIYIYQEHQILPSKEVRMAILIRGKGY